VRTFRVWLDGTDPVLNQNSQRVSQDIRRMHLISSIQETAGYLKRGFPGMIGSLDRIHWKWKNCPSALKGQYQGTVS
jgi:hypothetical protein